MASKTIHRVRTYFDVYICMDLYGNFERSFSSSPHDFALLFREPQETKLFGAKNCGRKAACFQLRIPMKHTMLQAYNCDRQKPGEKTERMPAEKQLYRPDYVKHHFIHYSTVTVMSIWNKKDTLKHGYQWKVHPFPDPLSRFGNEVSEGKQMKTLFIFCLNLCAKHFWQYTDTHTNTQTHTHTCL